MAEDFSKDACPECGALWSHNPACTRLQGIPQMRALKGQLDAAEKETARLRTKALNLYRAAEVAELPILSLIERYFGEDIAVARVAASEVRETA